MTTVTERPADKCNWEGRRHISLGPKFRIDANNPRMGNRGYSTFLIYGTTDNGDKHSQFLSEDGTFHILNDRSIEIVAGEKNDNEKGQDIKIITKTGELILQADENGMIRIKGPNICLEATEDIDIIAGRNLNLTSKGGQTLISGNDLNIEGSGGNLLEGMKLDFVNQVFAGSFVGADVLSGILGGAALFLIDKAIDTFTGD